MVVQTRGMTAEDDPAARVGEWVIRPGDGGGAVIEFPGTMLVMTKDEALRVSVAILQAAFGHAPLP